MGNEYDQRRTSYAVPSHENSYTSEAANAWAGHQYSSWDYGNKSGPFPGSLPPPAGDGDLQHQQPQEQPPLPSTPNMAMPNQHWYGYYPQQTQVCNFLQQLTLSIVRPQADRSRLRLLVVGANNVGRNLWNLLDRAVVFNINALLVAACLTITKPVLGHLPFVSSLWSYYSTGYIMSMFSRSE